MHASTTSAILRDNLDRPATIFEACVASGGLCGADARATDADSVKDCRMTAGSKARHRAKTTVKPCTGRHTDADLIPVAYGREGKQTPRVTGKNARKRAMRKEIPSWI